MGVHARAGHVHRARGVSQESHVLSLAYATGSVNHSKTSRTFCTGFLVFEGIYGIIAIVGTTGAMGTLLISVVILLGIFDTTGSRCAVRQKPCF